MTQASQHSTDQGIFHAISFRVGAEEYGLSLDEVQEIITLPRITRVPRAPDYVCGVINLHGNVVPVLDMARRFGIGSTRVGDAARIVVVDGDDEVVGLLAESVGRVVKLHEDAIQPPPGLLAGIAAEYLRGVVRTDDRFLIFLNLAASLRAEGGQEEEVQDDGE